MQRTTTYKTSNSKNQSGSRDLNNNTFNNDKRVTVSTAIAPDMVRRFYNLAASLKPDGAERSEFKITATDNGDGTTTIRIRAYSTKSWDDAAAKCSEFMRRNTYLMMPYEIACVSDAMYNTITEFVRTGRQNQRNDAIFSQKLGYYIISMNRDNGDVEVSMMLPVSEVNIDAEEKLIAFCPRFEEAVTSLTEEADLYAIIRRLDPSVIQVEENLNRQRQQEETTRQQMAERRAAHSAQQTLSADATNENPLLQNRFASLAIDEPETPVRSRQTWASRVAEASIDESTSREPARDQRREPARDSCREPARDQRREPARDQRREPARDQRREPARDQRREPARDQRREPARDSRREPTYKNRRNMSEIDCRYGEKCNRDDCGFRHPEERHTKHPEERHTKHPEERHTKHPEERHTKPKMVEEDEVNVTETVTSQLNSTTYNQDFPVYQSSGAVSSAWDD